MKPAVRYQGNHIIGFSHDEPTKAAKTVLAIIIAPMMGAPCICLSTNSNTFSKTHSQENTCARVSILIKLQASGVQNRDSGTGVFFS